MSLAPGTRIGPYELLGVLGEGGMGTVYRARDPRLLREVALKLLRADVVADRDREARFLQEARSVSALNHPNIVTVHDVGAEGGLAYMVMELVDGRSLDQLIPTGGMRPSEILRIGAQIADAFATAHGAQVVHRDLKPANVMVQPDGRVKVLDFGLAKLVDRSGGSDQALTQTAAGMIMGTAAYMSPEQAEGRPLDPRSDIFSFGALLYELCTGAHAFKGDSQASVLASVLRSEPEPIAAIRPDIPSEFARLVMRCLRKDPARRVQSMADLKVTFDDLREEVESGRIAVATPSAAPVTSRRPLWLAIGGAAVGAAIVAALTWGPFTATPAPPDAPGQPLPLTAYHGRETAPDFSPDGNQIVFMWDGDREDNVDVYAASIGGGPPLRLTTSPLRDIRPRWAPDGRHIAFIRIGADDAEETFSVMLVPPLGGPERKLAELQTRVMLGTPLASLAWSPDSKFLFVTGGLSRGQANDIQRVAIDTGEIQTLTHASEGANGYSQLIVAPDATMLAAVAYESSGAHTATLMSLSPTWELHDSRAFNSIAANIDTMAWTPDSRELVFRIAVNLPVPLYRASISGGVATPMSWVGADAHSPATSATAGRLAFSRTYRDTNIWRVPLKGSAGASPSMEQIAASSFREVSPHYSHDGTRLAFYSNRGGSIQIWTSNADGSRAAQLTNMDAFATTGSPRWSPDGRQLVFDSNAGGGYQIYVISADGGQPRRLTSGSSNFAGTWSPDGSWIYFASDRSGRAEIWRVPPQGGDAEQVTRDGGLGPRVSPDNVWLYYSKRDGLDGLWRRPIVGGEAQHVLPTMYRHNFTLTSTGVYFVPPLAPDGTSSVRFLDLATGSTREIAKIDKPVDLGIDVSPDGSWLLFTKLDYSGTDLMLVENFH